MFESRLEWPRFRLVCRVVAALAAIGFSQAIATYALARPDCTISDIGDDLQATVNDMQNLMSSPVCAALTPNPGFWIVAGAFTAGTTSTPQLHDACEVIQQVSQTAGDDQQKANDAIAQLPSDVQQTLQPVAD
jgi:hypothetical protein